MASKGRVLIVENNKDLLEMYALNLKSRSYSIDTADSVRTALKSLKQEDYEVLLVDLVMPGLESSEKGGMEVLRKAKEKDATIQVIMISGYGTIPLAVEALHLGARDFITKENIDFDKLIFLIKNAIDKRKKQLSQEIESLHQIALCFKSGEKCAIPPDKIKEDPTFVFIGMPFQSEFENAFQYAIRPALKKLRLQYWKADKKKRIIDLMCKICQGIQSCAYAVIDISQWNANVLFELGLAYGLGKSVVIIKKKDEKVPVDLSGLEYLPYDNYKKLKSDLIQCFKELDA
jgi:FixJ family two-component response regulator